MQHAKKRMIKIKVLKNCSSLLNGIQLIAIYKRWQIFFYLCKYLSLMKKGDNQILIR
jgi:hypothetical protein